MIFQLFQIRWLKCLLSVLMMSTCLDFILVSSDSKRVRELSATERSEEFFQYSDDLIEGEDENQLPFELDSTHTSLGPQHSQLSFSRASESNSSSTNAERARVIHNSEVDLNAYRQASGSEPDISCIEPDNTECGTLTLYTCAKEQSGLSSVNVTSSCRVDAFARLERANLLRCRANLSELLSRFALESSVMGMIFTSDVLYHYFHYLH